MGFEPQGAPKGAGPTAQGEAISIGSRQDREELLRELGHRAHIESNSLTKSETYCDIERLHMHGGIKAVAMDCIKYGLFNEQEAQRFAQIIGQDGLTERQRAKLIVELLAQVLTRHIEHLEREEALSHSVRLLRPAPSNIHEDNKAQTTKPFDPRENSGNSARPGVRLEYDREHREDPNAKYLAIMMERYIKLEEKKKERIKLAEEDKLRAKFLGVPKESLRTAQRIPEEQEV